MAVYKRGDKGVFYMNFTVNGVRVFKSTGKFNKREAKQVEAIERQKIIDQKKMTPAYSTETDRSSVLKPTAILLMATG